MNATIKWTKPEADEPYYVSACGTWEIFPLYLGRVRPQGWDVRNNRTGAKRRTYFGLKDAKAIAATLN